MSRNNPYHIGVANIASCKIWPLPILLAIFGEGYLHVEVAAAGLKIYCVYLLLSSLLSTTQMVTVTLWLLAVARTPTTTYQTNKPI